MAFIGCLVIYELSELITPSSLWESAIVGDYARFACSHVAASFGSIVTRASRNTHAQLWMNVQFN